MVAFAVAIVVVAAAMAFYRPAIDYAADPRAGAIRAFANGDSRYLAIDGESFLIGDEPIDPARDRASAQQSNPLPTSVTGAGIPYICAARTGPKVFHKIDCQRLAVSFTA